MDTQSFDLLGDPMLDGDHARLLDLVRALASSGHNAMPALEALRTEAREHFGREDAELRTLGGNNAVCHLDEHAAVLKSLDEVHLILGETATTRAMEQQLVFSLSLELLRWLPEHVREMDAGLAAVRTKSRFGGAPLRISRSLRSQALA